MALDAVSAADHQNGAVQHLERSLHLRGEINMPWGVQQGEGCSPIGELRLLGKDGDASLPLLSICIQKGVPMIHSPQLPQGTAQIQQPLGECGLAAVHMGQNPHANSFSHFFPWSITHYTHSPP